MKRAARLLSLMAAGLAIAPAIAAQQCAQSALSDHPPAINFRVDNDLLGGAQQDQGYTNGAMFTLVSPNLQDYTNDPCLPRLARLGNAPEGFMRRKNGKGLRR